MNTYLMFDYDSGEEFLVEAPDAEEALDIAKVYFADPSSPELIPAEEVKDFGWLDMY